MIVRGYEVYIRRFYPDLFKRYNLGVEKIGVQTHKNKNNRLWTAILFSTTTRLRL